MNATVVLRVCRWMCGAMELLGSVCMCFAFDLGGLSGVSFGAWLVVFSQALLAALMLRFYQVRRIARTRATTGKPSARAPPPS